jgi:hypothetical protein
VLVYSADSPGARPLQLMLVTREIGFPGPVPPGLKFKFPFFFEKPAGAGNRTAAGYPSVIPDSRSRTHSDSESESRLRARNPRWELEPGLEPGMPSPANRGS